MRSGIDHPFRRARNPQHGVLRFPIAWKGVSLPVRTGRTLTWDAVSLVVGGGDPPSTRLDATAEIAAFFAAHPAAE